MVKHLAVLCLYLGLFVSNGFGSQQQDWSQNYLLAKYLEWEINKSEIDITGTTPGRALSEDKLIRLRNALVDRALDSEELKSLALWILRKGRAAYELLEYEYNLAFPVELIWEGMAEDELRQFETFLAQGQGSIDLDIIDFSKFQGVFDPDDNYQRDNDSGLFFSGKTKRILGFLTALHITASSLNVGGLFVPEQGILLPSNFGRSGLITLPYSGRLVEEDDDAEPND